MFSLVVSFFVTVALSAAPHVPQNPPPLQADRKNTFSPADWSRNNQLLQGGGRFLASRGREGIQEGFWGKKIKFRRWTGPHLYCDDPKLFTALSKALDKTFLDWAPKHLPKNSPFRFNWDLF